MENVFSTMNMNTFYEHDMTCHAMWPKLAAMTASKR